MGVPALGKPLELKVMVGTGTLQSTDLAGVRGLGAQRVKYDCLLNCLLCSANPNQLALNALAGERTFRFPLFCTLSAGLNFCRLSSGFYAGRLMVIFMSLGRRTWGRGEHPNGEQGHHQRPAKTRYGRRSCARFH